VTDPRLRSRIDVVLTAVLFSTGGAAIKWTTLSGWQVASFRSGVAALTLLLLLREARRLPHFRELLVGAIYATTMILFVQANKLTTAANAIYLQATAPLYALLLAPWLLKEPVRDRDLSFLAVLAVGLGLFFLGTDAPTGTAPNPFMGNILATICGLTWALTLVGLRSLGKSDSRGTPAGAVVAGNILACLIALPFALPVVEASSRDWLTIAFLGTCQIGVAYALLTRAVHHVPALEVSLLLLIEPVLSPLWAWLFHEELPAGWSLAGCLTILVATAVKTVADARRLRAPA
jgi:DME family drug/metabolite transporter